MLKVHVRPCTIRHIINDKPIHKTQILIDVYYLFHFLPSYCTKRSGKKKDRNQESSFEGMKWTGVTGVDREHLIFENFGSSKVSDSENLTRGPLTPEFNRRTGTKSLG